MKQYCSICGKEYQGYGNNAQPVNEGRCCDICNYTTVIPRRMQEYSKTKEGEKDGKTSSEPRWKHNS